MVDPSKTVKHGLSPRRYFAILACTVCLTVIAPLFEHSRWSGVALGLLIILTLLTAGISITESGRRRLRVVSLAVLSGAMWVAASCLKFPPFNSVPFELVASTTCLLFFSYACYVMLQDILSGAITTNRICGAVCVYILAGFCFAIVHAMVAVADPTAYSESAKYNSAEVFRTVPLEGRYPPFVYFSFCTLTTTGYGDIFPIGRLARSLSWLEAVFGQFYMAILVARLIGLHIANTRNSEETLTKELVIKH